MRTKWSIVIGLIACAAWLEASPYENYLKRYERQIHEQERQLRRLQAGLAEKDRQARLWEQKADKAKTRWLQAKSSVEDAKRMVAQYKSQWTQAHALAETAQWSVLERTYTEHAANGQMTFLATELYKYQHTPRFLSDISTGSIWQRLVVEQLATLSQTTGQLAEAARQQESTYRAQEIQWQSAEQRRLEESDHAREQQQSQWHHWEEAIERRASLEEEKNHLEESAQALRVMLQELRDHRDQVLSSRQGSVAHSQEALKSLRATLPWPAVGRVTQTFGRQYSTDLQQWVISNGIKIEADPGRLVRTVQPGKVLFARPFQEYGPLVIVQHRDGLTSVYGELGDLQVKEGDVVSTLQPVGSVGDHRAFYFELRYNEEPINPLICLGPTHHTEVSTRRMYP